MRLDDAERLLVAALRGALPGSEAQKLLAPRPRKGWQPDVIPDDCRKAAGLLLLYPASGPAHLLLTKRKDDLPHHAGQVSLPGGAVEERETIEQGALREANEEVGLDPAGVRILGQLTPLHIPVSQFVLHPVVGILADRPQLRPHDAEVERLLEPTLNHLGDPTRYKVETRIFRGASYEVPYVDVDGEKLWGATAMILAELLVLLGYHPSPWPA